MGLALFDERYGDGGQRGVPEKEMNATPHSKIPIPHSRKCAFGRGHLGMVGMTADGHAEGTGGGLE